MTPAPPATTQETRPPRLLPLTIVLGVLFWIVATTGGRQVFVHEWLGAAFDSQAEHLLRGDPGVDPDAIRSESMIVNGQTRMYFGPFPAFVRMPLNYIYQAGRGSWSRFSGFCAGMVALAAFAGLVRTCLRSSTLSSRWRNWIGNICLAGFAFGSPILFFVASPTIYNESILWGLAWSIAALHFAFRSRKAEGAALTRSLLAFSFCVGAALLSRVTFGAPLLLIAPLLALRFLSTKQIRNLAALFLPLGTAVIFYLGLNYAKFGNFGGTSLNSYINPVQREFAQKYGTFDLARVPYSFADYFVLRRPKFQQEPPYLRAERFHPYNHPTLYVMPFTETFSSVLWYSSWILAGALIGLVLLLLPGSSNGLDRAMAVALLFQVIVILSFMGLAQRYTAELFPFLVFCFAIFLRSGGTALYHLRYVLIALVAVSIMFNTGGTASIVGEDGNLPAETRAFWKMGQTKK